MPKKPSYPVKVSLVTEPWGLWQSLQAARRNILEIIPDLATRQPMVSGKTGIRWQRLIPLAPAPLPVVFGA